MSYLIALDDGHGAQTPGKRTPVIPELGRSIRENEFNKAVVNYLDAELKRCGFRTLLVAAGDTDVALVTRTNRANAAHANAYVSVHYNAGGASGIESYHFPSSSKGKQLAQAIHKYVVRGTVQKNRGVKSANFHVLRETAMPAALIEYGFMDDPNLTEARRMLDVNFQKECAKETAQGICEFFAVKYVSGETKTQPSLPPKGNDASYHRLLKVTSPMMRGADVAKVQKRLRVSADGIYGPITRNAVINWQRVHDKTGKVVPSGKGLVPDGIVGPLTWGALF